MKYLYESLTKNLINLIQDHSGLKILKKGQEKAKIYLIVFTETNCRHKQYLSPLAWELKKGLIIEKVNYRKNRALR